MKTPILLDALQAAVDRCLPAARALRQALHACPEIALKERRTRELLARALGTLPLRVATPLLGTDLVATLDAGARRTVGLRADMDALPIREETGKPYQSAIPGMMHACGHDGHVACVAGAAMTLCDLRDRLDVNVRFIFQPGEEAVGAGYDLVEKGVCDGLAEVYALHANPSYPVGHVASRPGPLLAAAGFFEMEFRGVGCHGATPQAGRNPIPAASAVVARLEELHRRLNRSRGMVVSVCRLAAGTMNNVIPDTARVGGTFRYLEAADGTAVQKAIREAAEEAARDAGVQAKVELDVRYQLPVLNDAGAFDRFERLAKQYLPAGSFERVAEPTMFGEDFAYYLRDRPGLMFWLGMGTGGPPLHSPRFDFNDDALRHGIMMLCLLAAGERRPGGR